MRYGKIVVVLALLAPALAACATSGGMTVSSGAIANPSPKYRNAIAVRTVSGGQAMNVLTVPGVPNEPFKAALEATLAANGYLAGAGTPKFYLDAEIRNLDQPLMGLDLTVVADVTYNISGAGPAASYPIKAQATATFSDSPLGVDRIRIANERAMRENITQFLQALR
jgi:hypothetical protein